MNSRVDPGTEDAGPILLAILENTSTKSPRVHFNGHYDVVPAGSGWEYTPFKLTKVSSNLIGRGTADMKGGIATILGVLQQFLGQRRLRKGTVSLSIVPDEERGGRLGTGYLVERLPSPPDIVFTPEPSMPYLITVTVGSYSGWSKSKVSRRMLRYPVRASMHFCRG